MTVAKRVLTFGIPTRTLPDTALRILSFCCLLFISTRFAEAQTWSAKGPIPRGGHSAVFDPSTNRMIVFGGQQELATDLNDVWRLNGATGAGGLTWVSVKPSGVAPAARVGHTAVYASASNRMIIFGGGEGNTSPCQNDVWALENANGNGGTPIWAQLNPAGSLPAARVFGTSVYDSSSDSMILFGGEDCFATNFGDVWVLSHASGVNGTPTWTQLAPSGATPAARAFHTAVYAPASNTMTIFAGESVNGTFFNDVWVLSNANGTGGTPSWTQLTPSGSAPVPREVSSAIYNGTANRMTIFAGIDSGNNPLRDVWVLTNANGLGGTPAWIQISASAIPPAARGSHTAVYNAISNVMTVFGGGAGSIQFNDVFTLTHADGL